MSSITDLLKNRSLVILGISESVSNIGNWITMLAIFSLVVFHGSGGIAESSGVFLSGLLPLLIVSPLAGWLCDHVDRKILLISSELLSGAAVTGLVFVDRLEYYYALLALQAVFTSIMMPARQAVIPDIVDRADLARANAFLQQLAGMIKIGAPILAGGILALLNPHLAIILDVISFVLSAIILSRLPSLPPHPQGAGRETNEGPIALEKGEKVTVLKIIRSSPGLGLLFISLFTAIFIIVGFDVLSSVYIRDILHADEKVYGALIGLVGAGTLLSTGYMMVDKKESRPWRDMILGLIFLSLIPLAFTLGTVTQEEGIIYILAFLGCFFGGAGNGLIIVQSGTLLQSLSPGDMLGRLGGVYQISAVGGQLAGIVLTPLLVPGLLDMRAYFTLSTIGLLLLTIILILSVRRVLTPSGGD